MENNNQTSPEQEINEFKGQGDFSLKPAGRKKDFDKRIIAVIGGGVFIVIIASVLIGYMAIKSMGDAETKVDESKVTESPLLQSAGIKDDSMDELMSKSTASPSPSVSLDNAPSPEAVSQTQTEVKKETVQKNESSSTETQQPQRLAESLFTPITRFESSGLSGGSGSSSGSSGGTYGGTPQGTGDDEQRLRDFANADPAEQVQKILNGGGGTILERGNGGSGGSGLLDNLNGSSYPATKARLAPNPKYLLKRRMNFQCALYTAIRTDYPGLVGCNLLRPLYSADGSVILAEAGAQLIGEQRVEVKSGQSSVATVWTELDTSPGVRASLNGLGVDPMGRSGTDAEMDNHYGKRFGGAVMLSLVQDVFSSISNATQNNNGMTMNNSTQNAEDMASKALENSINIPPTAYVKPGTVINVIVNQDIDFSSVFTTR
ncbi:TPA: TrbI/VirB10 family protein [Escherichia coli]|uniref:TrbI/VirB10 family protein n=1 Tax=Enterobacter hormaechei TaxID=158836 RepID=UPI001D5A2ACF|nr:TrbI/VirB10 family protein [Salmonella enterica]EHB7391036.1 TrbI/VirB10 family protein [Shigella flexneri]HDC5041473.1 TrbI/VirB10 family protein [Escherichia coli]EEV5388887.1 TrbI/VirB10 family protein [Salmonella enterica]EHV1159858.1 TrbI/VirB10 family protein [Shigella flexneri]